MVAKNLLRIIIISLLACSIFFIGMLLGLSIGVNKGSESVLNTLDNGTIKKEINKPTTEVTNNTANTTNIKKIKANKDGVISTMLENKNDSKAKIESIKPIEEDLNPFTSICIDTLNKSRREVINELKKHYK